MCVHAPLVPHHNQGTEQVCIFKTSCVPALWFCFLVIRTLNKGISLASSPGWALLLPGLVGILFRLQLERGTRPGAWLQPHTTEVILQRGWEEHRWRESGWEEPREGGATGQENPKSIIWARTWSTGLKTIWSSSSCRRNWNWWRRLASGWPDFSEKNLGAGMDSFFKDWL